MTNPWSIHSMKDAIDTAVMDWRNRSLTIDDVRDWTHHPDNEFWDFELLEGDLIPRAPHGFAQGVLAADFAFHLSRHVMQTDAGICTIGSGYYPEGENDTLVGTDVAFLSHERDPGSPPEEWVAAMPDIALELFEPWDSLALARRKAEVYMRKGSRLFWLVLPMRRAVEVSRLDADARIETESLGLGDTLSGEDILPGFQLELSELFAVLRD